MKVSGLTLVLLLLSGPMFAADLPVIVKAVNMETAAASGPSGGATYNYHSMTVDVDGATYKITRRFVLHETWLHKGTYVGRWMDSKKRRLQIDMDDNGKVRRVTFDVLSEE